MKRVNSESSWRRRYPPRRLALGKVANLETDLKSTWDDLALARRGESQAGKLDSELKHAREDSEGKLALIV
jgi:hypothetical protein